jgi:hypothetical protein
MIVVGIIPIGKHIVLYIWTILALKASVLDLRDDALAFKQKIIIGISKTYIRK